MAKEDQNHDASCNRFILRLLLQTEKSGSSSAQRDSFQINGKRKKRLARARGHDSSRDEGESEDYHKTGFHTYTSLSFFDSPVRA